MDSPTQLPIAPADIDAAAERLKGIAHRTPTLTSRTADAATGAKLFFKCENLQRMGAFKFRGAYNSLAQFTPSSGAPAWWRSPRATTRRRWRCRRSCCACRR